MNGVGDGYPSDGNTEENASRANGTLIFVAGTPRSGSTLLGALLDRSPSTFNAGELISFWRAQARNSSCSCGQPIRNCLVWSRILERTLGSRMPDVSTLEGLYATQQKRHGETYFRRRQGHGQKLEMIPHYAKLLQAIRDVTGCNAIVDSSKSWKALPSVAAVDSSAKIIHLVRDPVAVANSERRIVSVQTNDDPPPLRGVTKSALHWVSENILIRSVGKREGLQLLLINYEELALDPHGTLKSIAEFAGIDDLPPSELDAADAVLVPLSHAAAGNPSRHDCGEIRVVPDMRHETDMGRGRSLLVLGIAAAYRRRLRQEGARQTLAGR